MVVLPSRARTVYAGLAAGAIAGAGGFLLAWTVGKRVGVDLVGAIAGSLSRGPLSVVPGIARGLLPPFAIALFVGVLVALVTRHVRRAIPVSIFGAIFVPTTWLALHVVALHRAPWLVSVLPLGPMLLGCALFGLLLGSVVAIRG